MNEVLFNSPFHLVWIILTLGIVIGVAYWAKWREKSCNKAGLIAFTTLYSALVVASVVAATKIIIFKFPFGIDFFVPAGVIVYAASFLVTDLISEVYGKKDAMTAVWLGFASMLIFSLYSLLMTGWQSAPYWTNQECFQSVVGLSLRITFAGIISFVCSQSWDVFVFHILKNEKKWWGTPKHLWIRNNVSTITSQFIDSTIFISIAFVGIYDNIIGMIIAQWVVKCIIAAIDTPFAYWGRNILNRQNT